MAFFVDPLKSSATTGMTGAPADPMREVQRALDSVLGDLPQDGPVIAFDGDQAPAETPQTGGPAAVNAGANVERFRNYARGLYDDVQKSVDVYRKKKGANEEYPHWAYQYSGMRGEKMDSTYSDEIATADGTKWKRQVKYSGGPPACSETRRIMTTVRPDGTKVIVQTYAPGGIVGATQGVDNSNGEPRPGDLSPDSSFQIFVLKPDGTGYCIPPQKPDDVTPEQATLQVGAHYEAFDTAIQDALKM